MDNEFLNYLATSGIQDNGKLPGLQDLSKKLNKSLPSLREQLELARAMGVVEIRPRAGLRKLPFSFSPSTKFTAGYALRNDPQLFQQYWEMRNHLEISYWYEAVQQLTDEDIRCLKKLLLTAQQKLKREPFVVPVSEHRQLHMRIISKIENVFVVGLLETYWDLYEELGLSISDELAYHQKVWQYHERIIDAISVRDFNLSYQLLREHMNLLTYKTRPNLIQSFE